jgi:hypothetical protein
MLRAWQLALLRFAITLDHVERLNVMAVAQEMDRGGRTHEARTEFSFFRKTSADLCTSICGRTTFGRFATTDRKRRPIQRVLISRSVDRRTRVSRAIWGRVHAYNNLPAGIFSPARTRLET